MIDALYRESLRIARLLFGLLVFSVGVVMTLKANLGYPPWFVFHHGVGLHLGLTIGTATVLVSFVIILTAVLMKEYVGFGTICNMIFVGAFVDILLPRDLIPLMESFVPGVAMMICGLFTLALGTVIYLGAGYGAGPRDTFMVIITKLTGKPVGLCRSCIEGMVLFTGWLLGGYAGIGTVISVFGIGVAVQTVFSFLRFDVKTIPRESFYETFMRFRNMLR